MQVEKAISKERNSENARREIITHPHAKCTEINPVVIRPSWAGFWCDLYCWSRFCHTPWNVVKNKPRRHVAVNDYLKIDSSTRFSCITRTRVLRERSPRTLFKPHRRYVNAHFCAGFAMPAISYSIIALLTICDCTLRAKCALHPRSAAICSPLKVRHVADLPSCALPVFRSLLCCIALGLGGGAGIVVREPDRRADWISSCRILPRRRSI